MAKIITIVKRNLRDSRKSMIIVAIISVCYALFLVGYFPSINKAGAGLQSYFKSMPEAMLKSFGMSNMDFSLFSNFASVEYFGFVWAILYLPFLLSWASRLAAEAEKGTLALILTYPIKRNQILLGHVISVTVQSIYIAVIAVLPTIILALVNNISLDVGHWLVFTAFFSLTMTTIGLLTLALSAIILHRGRSVQFITAFLVIGYLINVMSQLVGSLNTIKYISFFYYFGDPLPILKDGIIRTSPLLVFPAMIAVALMAAFVIFPKKDLPNG